MQLGIAQYVRSHSMRELFRSQAHSRLIVDQSGKFCRQCGDIVLNNPTFLLGQIGCGDIKPKKRFTCDDECVDVSAVGSHHATAFL